jgi:3-deoxy-D-manno-octulosonate 8-phosphate phosphatase (KDO 8-P phosphatase)
MTTPGATARERARGITALVLDVDGVLTDGRIHYAPSHPDEEAKSFHCRDGLGLRLAGEAGLRLALLTGRKSSVVARRARELGIPDVMQGAYPKLPVFEDWCRKRNVTPQEVAYMGDDLVDIPIMRRVGLAAAVADAHPEALKAAAWVSTLAGGNGAVRELIEFMLRAQDRWDAVAGPLLA